MNIWGRFWDRFWGRFGVVFGVVVGVFFGVVFGVVVGVFFMSKFMSETRGHHGVLGAALRSKAPPAPVNFTTTITPLVCPQGMALNKKRCGEVGGGAEGVEQRQVRAATQ